MKFFFEFKEYLIDELNCHLCCLKEKSQFLLNIFRYIQHASFQNQYVKLEIFKVTLINFLKNNF